MSTNTKKIWLSGCCALALNFGLGMYSANAAGNYGDPYNFGTTPTKAEIAKWDVDVTPDGRGAPMGKGTYAKGKEVYAENCLACHGENLEGIPDVGGDKLIGGRGTLASGSAVRTVESFWPYASTLFDYVTRAMPFNAPGSLSNDEVYSVVAYILGEAKVISKDTEMNAKTLAEVKMPNRNGFISDPRPDVLKYD